ncbi:MAG: hypothetical protein NZ576_02500 [Bacteroidia bacterium]|nr:hypothetical protein [Bacteroidia bacterium]
MEFIFSQQQNEQWQRLMSLLKEKFQQEIKLEGLLLLIGIQEIGGRVRPYTKEEKIDLMHVGLCAILEPAGYYKKTHIDSEGWPHWELVRPLENRDVFNQKLFLRYYILEYFLKIFPQELLSN